MEGHGHVVIAGHTTGGENGQTGYLSLEHVEGRGRRGVLDGFGFHGGHGTNQVGNLLAGTVTDHHGLLNEGVVLFQDHIDLGAAVDLDFLLGVTHHGVHEGAVGGGGDSILTGGIGGRAVGGPLHNDIGSYDGTARIADGTAYLDALLGHRREGGDQQHQRSSKKLDCFHNDSL